MSHYSAINLRYKILWYHETTCGFVDIISVSSGGNDRLTLGSAHARIFNFRLVGGSFRPFCLRPEGTQSPAREEGLELPGTRCFMF